MSREDFEHGQKAEAKSRNNGLWDEFLDQTWGTGIYDIPSDPEAKKDFLAGVENAKNNPPKK